MAFTFRTKLLASHVGLVLVVVAVLIGFLDRSLAADLERQLDQRLEQQAHGATQWGANEGRRHPEKVAARLATVLDDEVTIFDGHGEVVGDSRGEAAMHEEPGPEVAAALSNEVGRATRVRSNGEEMHYVAVSSSDGWVIRLAAPLSDINATRAATRRRILFGTLLAVLAALALGLLASRVASGPLRAMTVAAQRIAGGDFDIDVGSASPDEFGVLSTSLASLARQLKARIGELSAERDRLSAILAGMAEGVLVLDPKGTIVLANPAAATVLEREPPLEGLAVDNALPPSPVRAFITEALSGGDARETEIELGERWIAVYVRPLDASGAAGLVSVVRDMTPIRKVMTMRRDFMANASHELRTPVTAIQGYAETLLRGSADATKSKQFLEVIHRHALRLGALVDDVLKLTELEDRPKERSVREPVDVAGAAAAAADTVRGRAASASMRIDLDVPEGLRIEGDPTGLEQVFENLLDNAVKYGRREGGGVVRVKGTRDAKTGEVELTVSDEGAGIEARHLPRLFERFYRVDAGRSRDQGGTGLGLAIVKQLVESMGGRVDVTSTVGAGTTFVLHFSQM